MLVDGNSDIADLYGVWGAVKGAAKGTVKGAAKVVTKTIPKAVSKTASFTVNKAAPFVGKMALAPIVLPTKAAIGVVKGVGGAAGGAAGTILGAPLGILKTVGSNVAKGFKAGAAGPGGEPTPTQAAAQDVLSRQPQGDPTTYSPPGGGYSGGGGGGGGYESASSGLTDTSGQAAPTGMSTTTKIALGAGAVAVAYLLYSRSKGRGGRRK